MSFFVFFFFASASWGRIRLTFLLQLNLALLGFLQPVSEEVNQDNGTMRYYNDCDVKVRPIISEVKVCLTESSKALSEFIHGPAVPSSTTDASSSEPQGDGPDDAEDSGGEDDEDEDYGHDQYEYDGYEDQEYEPNVFDGMSSDDAAAKCEFLILPSWPVSLIGRRCTIYSGCYFRWPLMVCAGIEQVSDPLKSFSLLYDFHTF